jgi:hypothetical protein
MYNTILQWWRMVYFHSLLSDSQEPLFIDIFINTFYFSFNNFQQSLTDFELCSFEVNINITVKIEYLA